MSRSFRAIGRQKKNFLAGLEGHEEKKEVFLKANEHDLVDETLAKLNCNSKLHNNSFL